MFSKVSSPVAKESLALKNLNQ